jgi:nucleotide-binding universal stress UspA family protein
MAKIRNVVIPIDGSRHADRGILPGKRLAAALGLGVGVMEVVTEPREGGDSFLQEALQDEDLDWSSVTISSDVASAIDATASENDAMVCMAIHGHGRSIALIGSIPEDVVRHATTPIALVGPNTDVYERGPIRQLVVAVDGTTFGEAVCAPAALWASEHKLLLHFVTVVQPTPEAADPKTPSDRWFGPVGDEHAYMSDLVSRFESPSLNVKGTVVYDAVSPAGGLAQILRDKPDTILVLGTHGRTGMSRLVHGSVASNIVAESPVPVLMFPFHRSDADRD